MSQVILLDVGVSQFANSQIDSYASNTILQLIDENDYTVESTVVFGSPQLNQQIRLDVALSSFETNQISEFASTSIIQLIDQFDASIDSTLVIGDTQSNAGATYPISIESTLVIPSVAIRRAISPETIESTLTFGNATTILSITLEGISSEILFGTAGASYLLSAQTIESTATIPINAKLNTTIYSEAIASTALFGWDDPLVNMEIDNVPFPAIESTAVIPSVSVLPVIRPLAINTTVNFGVSSFTSNIHRLLIFKDDNITKVGNTDAVVLAGGIRLNPSSLKSTEAYPGEATLPANPVGFLSINIDGNDYRIPYYN